jgi:hypothetical protein
MSAQLHQLAVVMQPVGVSSVIKSVEDFDPSAVAISTTEREVLFSHGTQLCSVGTIDLAAGSMEQEERNFVGNKLALAGLPMLLSQICEREAENLTRVIGGISNLDSVHGDPVNHLLERMERLVSHILGTEEVSDALKVSASMRLLPRVCNISYLIIMVSNPDRRPAFRMDRCGRLNKLF